MDDYKSRKQNTPTTKKRKRFPAENDPSTSNDYKHITASAQTLF